MATLTVAGMDIEPADVEKIKQATDSEAWPVIERLWQLKITELLARLAARGLPERDADTIRGQLDAHNDLLSFKPSFDEAVTALAKEKSS